MLDSLNLETVFKMCIRDSSSCMTGISKDLKLTYANIFVQLGKKTTGGEIVYGVQAR